MRYGSICSGIESATAAWHPLGRKPAFFSEIDAFPRSVLAHHYPDTPLHGDFTTIKKGDYEPIDILVGGTPCQAFSVAGLRKGLDDPRGNLTLGFLGLIDRLRPRWVVWENVPGVLSVDGGRVFGTFLGGLGELGYGFAYRILDAQFFGVAQRRRRVFVVAYAGNWRRAAAVLFERASLSGNPSPRREAGQGIAAGTQGRAGIGSHWDGENVHPTLNRGANTSGGIGYSNQEVFSQRGSGLVPDVAGCLQERDSKGVDSDTKPGHLIPVAFAIQGAATRENPASGPDGVGVRGDNCAYTIEARPEVQAVAFSCKDHGADATSEIAPTLRAMGHAGSHANAGGQLAIAFHPTQDPISSEDGTTHAMGCGSKSGTATVAVAFAQNTRDEVREMDVVGALAAQPGMKQTSYIRNNMQVRRLTPRECERLQGFPDDFTLVPHRGKPAADGPRYKALGNSMAVPVMAWIGKRIQMVESIPSN